MLTVLSATPAQLQEIRSLVPTVDLVQSHKTWVEFERSLAYATCALVFIPRLDDDHVSRLRQVSRLFPLCRTILVTTWDLNNARQLKDTRVSEVIWLCEFTNRIRSLFHNLLGSHSLDRMGDLLDTAPELPRTLATALADACRRELPFRSVQMLAASHHCDRHTLWLHWHHSTPQRTLRLKDFLDWIVLLRAVMHKIPMSSWRAIAFQLNVHEHTLGRHAHRLTRYTLSQIEELGYATLEREFFHHVLQAFPGICPVAAQPVSLRTTLPGSRPKRIATPQPERE